MKQPPCLAAASRSAHSVPPLPTQKPAETVTMEAFTVTDSNIKRPDLEKPLPVTIISADEIEAREAAITLRGLGTCVRMLAG